MKSQMKRRTKIAHSGFLLSLLLLSSCGFHLRSWDLGVSMESASVVSESALGLRKALEKSLRQSGVMIVAVEENPNVQLEILDENINRRSVSVTGLARVAEYRLTLTARLRISEGEEVLADNRRFVAERTFRLDRDNIVGSSEEQALLTRELRADVVQQIFRTLNALI
jgi:LPS-assembly lipoprotein